MEDTAARLLLPLSVWHAVQAHVQACLPEEACGLLGGCLIDGEARIARVIPVENALHSPVRFRMDPRAQLAAFQDLEAAGLELLAIFHSHPRGPQQPSRTDLAEFAYPGVVSLIVSPGTSEAAWQGRAFHIQGGFPPNARSAADFFEIPLLIDPGA